MKKQILFPVNLLLAGLFLMGCSVPQAPKVTDEVKLQLKWLHQAQFAGFYLAREKGYYAGENINVTFLEGAPDIDIVQRVASGQADFGVLTPESIFVKRSQGIPLTAISAIYRHSAVVFVAKTDSRIVRPSDFIGKSVAVTGSGGAAEFEIQFRAMMRQLRLDVSKVKLVPYDPDYTTFYDGKVEITPCYATSGLLKIRRKALKLNLIWPGDYGIHFYSDTLTTTERLIAEKPGLATRFLRASLKGWKDAVEDYRDTAAVTLKYAGVKDPEFQTAMLEAMLPFIHTGEDRIGWMKDEMWVGMYQMLLDQKLLSRPLDIGQVYTLRFLKEIYGGKGK